MYSGKYSLLLEHTRTCVTNGVTTHLQAVHEAVQWAAAFGQEAVQGAVDLSPVS